MKKPFIKLRVFLPLSSEEKKPKIFSLDAGLSLAFLDRVSCFETLRAYRGRFFGFSEHWQRLDQSCRAIGKAFPMTRRRTEHWTKEALKESGFQDAMLRISAHWGDRGQEALVAIVKDFQAHPKVLYQKGVFLSTSVVKRWTLKAQDPQIKASQFMGGVLAFLDNKDLEAREFLFLNQNGAVAEGTVSNIFIVREKRLLTPSVGSGILRGVTRAVVMDLARKRGWDVRETFLTRHELYTAEECFITNTSSEVLPVVRVDQRTIGSGRPGPVAMTLLKDFRSAVIARSRRRRSPPAGRAGNLID